MDLHGQVLAGAERAADAGQDQPHLVRRQAEAGRDLRLVHVQPLGGHVQLDPAVLGGHRQAGLRAEERLILHADLVLAADHEIGLRVRVSPPDPHVPDQVAARVYRCRAGRQRGLRVGDRGEHVVVDRDRGQPRGGRFPGGRPRRSRPAHPGSGPRRRPAPAGRRLRGRRSCARARRRGSARRRPRAGAAHRRCSPPGCGPGDGGCAASPPHSMSAIHRSDENANSPVTFRVPSGRSTLAPTPLSGRPVIVAGPGEPGDDVTRLPLRAPRRSVAPSPAERRRESFRSRCTGTGCLPAPRGSAGPSGPGTRRSRSSAATISPGVQNPHWTAPASRNACWTTSSAPARLPAALHRVPPHRDALHGAHVPALRLAGRDQAGAHHDAVEVDRAGPALALLAGVLGARQAEPLAEHEQQRLALPHVVGDRGRAVDRAGHAHRRCSCW